MISDELIEVIGFVDSTGIPCCPFCMQLIRNITCKPQMRMKNYFKIEGVNYMVHYDCKKGINDKTIKGFKKGIISMGNHPTYKKRVFKYIPHFHSKKGNNI